MSTDAEETTRAARDCVCILLSHSLSCCRDLDDETPDTRFKSPGFKEPFYDVEGEWTDWQPFANWDYDDIFRLMLSPDSMDL